VSRVPHVPERSKTGSAHRLANADAFEAYRRDGDPATRALLTSEYLPLARHLARRYRGRAELDDLEQVASLGLLKALDRFDPSRGIEFSTFAYPTILGEIRRYFRDVSWTVRVPRELQELTLRLDRLRDALSGELGRSPTVAELAAHADSTIEQVTEALSAGSAHHPDSLDRPLTAHGDLTIDIVTGQDDPGLARAEDAAVVEELLARLSGREREILILRFEKDLTQAEIGKRVGISQMQVSRVIRQSIASLQIACQAGGLASLGRSGSAR
jgi:RNA polymerase sigma-B factor